MKAQFECEIAIEAQKMGWTRNMEFLTNLNCLNNSSSSKLQASSCHGQSPLVTLISTDEPAHVDKNTTRDSCLF